MRAENDRSVEGAPSERRSRRASCLVDALRFQLDACREAEGLTAIVVSDELGFCVAHSGGDGAHTDLAARLPTLFDPKLSFEDLEAAEPSPPLPESLVVTTFFVEGARLHACAVGTPHARSAAVLERVASGFSRMLAQ